MLVNIGPGNGLLPYGTKPLPEPILTNNEILWHSPKGNLLDDIYPWYEFENN